VTNGPTIFFLRLNIYVPGCPPTAEALLYGVILLQKKIRRTGTIASADWRGQCVSAGLGPKRVKLLWDQLGVAMIDALRRAAEVGRFCSIRGFETKVERTSDPESRNWMVLVPMSRFAIDVS
jgi:hypothetical protein